MFVDFQSLSISFIEAILEYKFNFSKPIYLSIDLQMTTNLSIINSAIYNSEPFAYICKIITQNDENHPIF